MRIIDANILIYAFDSSASQNATAVSWLTRVFDEDDLVGFPRVVLLAFLRITTNPRIMTKPASNAEALTRIETLLRHPKTFVIEGGPNHWSILAKLVIDAGVFGPAITDAHLAAIAIEHGATLCSHDTGFRRFDGLKFENPFATT